jgi:hypothetical protein
MISIAIRSRSSRDTLVGSVVEHPHPAIGLVVLARDDPAS